MVSRVFVIVGAGLAGVRAADTLRDAGFDGRVVLLGEESDRPYDRVTLSKHYLYRAPGFHGLFLHDEAYYASRGIELRLGSRAASLDPGARTVLLATGEQIRYEAVLLATGAEPRHFTGPGAELHGVHYLRTLGDADRLRTALDDAATRSGRVTVVGSGWIGCEVAAAAGHLGLAVTLVGRDPMPLQRQVGQSVAEFLLQLHREHGVEVRGGEEVVSVRGTDRVHELVLDDGTVLPCDLVVFGIGALPRTALARQAGLVVDDGIVTDEFFATSRPGVFAAGDVANVFNRALGRHVRLEHFAAAHTQGAAAARAMLGGGEPYREVPFFFSDQYDMWMECTGDLTGADRFVIRTLPGRERFLAFWLRRGRLAAGMNVNIKGVPDAIRDLIVGGRRIDTTALADPDVPLERTADPAVPLERTADPS